MRQLWYLMRIQPRYPLTDWISLTYDGVRCEETPGGVFLSYMSHRLVLGAEAQCAFLKEIWPNICKPCVSRLEYCSVPAEVCVWRLFRSYCRINLPVT